MKIAEWFSDFGVSGGASIDRRPGLLAALDALDRVMVLVVANRDHLARDVVVAAMTEQLVARKGGR